MPSRETLERAMYELGRHEIAAAKVPVLWRYIARAKSREDFWKQWPEVTPEEIASAHILRILVIGYTSEKQLEYEERVLMDTMDILLVIRAMRVRMPHRELKWEPPNYIRRTCFNMI